MTDDTLDSDIPNLDAYDLHALREQLQIELDALTDLLRLDEKATDKTETSCSSLDFG